MNGISTLRVQRGLAQHKLDRDDAALADLQRSLEYLPTAPAHLVLGDIKARRGAVAAAVEHYKVVAEGGGDVGKAAYERLVYLDLEQQPAAYVASACGADANGQVTIQVRNDTPVAVTAVEVRIRYVDSAGNEQQRTQSFSGTLEPAKVVTARTGLTAYPSTRCVAEVTRARAAP